MCPPTTLPPMPRLIPGAKLVTIDGAGHAPQVEQPERFVTEIETFAGLREVNHENLALQRDRLSLSAGPGRLRVGARRPAQPLLRPGEGRRPVRPLHRGMAGRRGGRPRDHAQRASSDADLRRSRRPAAACSARTRHQQGAPSDPRQSGRQPPPAGARRRGDGVCRHPVARPHRGRLCARRALRDFAGEFESGLHQRAPVGGDRPHPQGVRPRTTARSATRAASSTPGGSTSGRGPTSSRIRRSG